MFAQTMSKNQGFLVSQKILSLLFSGFGVKIEVHIISILPASGPCQKKFWFFS